MLVFRWVKPYYVGGPVSTVYVEGWGGSSSRGYIFTASLSQALKFDSSRAALAWMQPKLREAGTSVPYNSGLELVEVEDIMPPMPVCKYREVRVL